MEQLIPPNITHTPLPTFQPFPMQAQTLLNRLEKIQQQQQNLREWEEQIMREWDIMQNGYIQPTKEAY